MPLIKSSSREAVSENIRREMAANKPQRQAVAIALDVARRAKAAKRAAGGMLGPGEFNLSPRQVVRGETRNMLRGAPHEGPIRSVVPGRTDQHNMDVEAGSYVIPSHAVSHLGQNNTEAGMDVLNRMFKMGPYGGPSMPMARGPKLPGMGRRAAGGRIGEPVPVVTAGGEFVVPARIVKEIGEGDLSLGHKILDRWMLKIQKEHAKTIRKLPAPAKK